MTTFDAERVALEMIAALRKPLERLERRNRQHAAQAREAASSVPHNLSEGRRRRGRDRLYHWSVAAGSAGELRNNLAVAVAWGWLTDEELLIGRSLLDRVLAMTWRMLHPRRRPDAAAPVRG